MFTDLLEVLSLAGLSTAALVVYLIFIRKSSAVRGKYIGWNYPLKLLYARYAVRQWKSKIPKSRLSEVPQTNLREGWDSVVVRASATNGTSLILGIRKLCELNPVAEVTVFVKLSDGSTYRLPQHPETAIGAWETIADGWSAGGLKIQVLEHEQRLRILYNGLLIKDDDKLTRHVKMNLIWASASSVKRFPEDWSNQLAAQALALQQWRDGDWPDMLKNCGDRSWLQWGALQGRFESYDDNGIPDTSEYLRVRGVRERSWSSKGYKGLRRSINLTVSAPDGTAVQIRAMSYKNDFTQCLSGCVRFPNYMVESVTSTDLVMSEFCETEPEIPRIFTINVSTSERCLKLVIRINSDGGKLYSGVPREQETVFRTVLVDMDGVHGTGILELGYEVSAKIPSLRLSPPRLLKWLSEREAGPVGYCVSFEDRAAACPEHVGGKGASLALLASVQHDEGYRVPPGFCLTTKALEKHLETNPEIMNAIMKISAANEEYEENNFKKMCTEASDLLTKTEITREVKQEILRHMKDLRKKAMDENFGEELRFAVRSSAVGEDSEALSAAGQNETVLGCKDDEDVLRGVQKCWASMFAFTSAYYRRQNGQACWCGGGAAVQAMARARTAGVLFSRLPAGDPARLLLTANYGLGETVVSGSVEPDTIIVKRDGDTLKISKIEVGSKLQRVTVGGEGVDTEDVPEDLRTVSCLTESQILRLAKIGVSQELLWGAGRDIEWAISKEDEIFLLQARPITSLERWTEEELLHELDFPIMADDELTTFANTGEVFPKPFTPLSYDLVGTPLASATYDAVGSNGDGYDQSIISTHNRFALALYNSLYRRLPKEIDVGVRMLEMSIHGHKVATDEIHQTALHRRSPKYLDKIVVPLRMLMEVFFSQKILKSAVKCVDSIDIGTDTNDPMVLLNRITGVEDHLRKCSYYHNNTTSASTFSQFVAMSVLLEGQPDFSPEQCNEISTLLSSGNVLSAEVPHELANLARQLELSGRAEEFREQDPKEALGWLKTNLPQIYSIVSKFLEQHGHRAVMEFDLATKPWALVPEELMKVLAHMRLTREDVRNPKSDEEIVNSLKTPQKSSTRKVLRWILPLCRRTVCHREGTKASFILAVHKLRLAAIRLGHLLVRHWYLPHYELVFFFRVHELRKYITTRDPALLKKAIQRQQYYAGWCKLKFAELNTGWVEPLKVQGPRITSGNAKVEATPACSGEIIARACVVKDLSEIGELQQGDILITHSTDIGWSPYFPLLSGIVTELGGLISHGAVIAREYGLPCIVGAINATDIFRTGDLVRLSGISGTVEKVHVDKNDDDS